MADFQVWFSEASDIFVFLVFMLSASVEVNHVWVTKGNMVTLGVNFDFTQLQIPGAGQVVYNIGMSFDDVVQDSLGT